MMIVISDVIVVGTRYKLNSISSQEGFQLQQYKAVTSAVVCNIVYNRDIVLIYLQPICLL